MTPNLIAANPSLGVLLITITIHAKIKACIIFNMAPIGTSEYLWSHRACRLSILVSMFVDPYRPRSGEDDEKNEKKPMIGDVIFFDYFQPRMLQVEC